MSRLNLDLAKMRKQKITIFWFRRDLRLVDNSALYYALKENENVLPIFIFDKNILNELENNFYNNAQYPFFSDDHKEYLKQQFSLYSDSVMSKIDFRDYDLEKFDNLDKYKFI